MLLSLSLKGKACTLTNFLFLYVNVVVTFTVVYLCLDIFDLGGFENPYSTNHSKSFPEKITESLYLSSSSLFLDSHKEIMIAGWSKIVLFIESTVGFVIPPIIMFYLTPVEKSKFERNKFPILHLLIQFFFVALGAILVSLGLEIFLVPNHIIDGGIVGISIIMSYLTGFKLELYLLLLNLPFLYLGYIQIGKRFVVITLLGISILSITMFFLYNIPVLTDNPILACVFGGICLGIGVGIVIRYGGSLDGTEILGILLNKRSSFSIGKVIMFINVFIFCTAGFIFGWDKALYSILTYYIASKMIDLTLDGFRLKV